MQPRGDVGSDDDDVRTGLDEDLHPSYGDRAAADDDSSSAGDVEEQRQAHAFMVAVDNRWPVQQPIGDDRAVTFLSRSALQAGFDTIVAAPADAGELRLIARRPEQGQREVVATAELDLSLGLVGDNWLARGSRHTPDGSAAPDKQITVMNVRVAELVAGSLDRVPLSGDQLFVDLDLSVANLPPGTLLSVGTAVLEVSEAPHLGCKKFVARFGTAAMRFVNSPVGRQLRMRGMNTRVVVPGRISVGDLVTRTLPEQTGASPAAVAVEG